MPIYDFPKKENERVPYIEEQVAPATEVTGSTPRDQIFSATAARLFFLLLLAADILWAAYSLTLLAISLAGYALTGGKVERFKSLCEKSWISLRRSLVCGVSLLIALFHPAFGIMIACTYFLMYDKTGIDEVIPTSLQSQFKEFLPRDHN
jgi:hypothetical protein